MFEFLLKFLFILAIFDCGFMNYRGMVIDKGYVCILCIIGLVIVGLRIIEPVKRAKGEKNE